MQCDEVQLQIVLAQYGELPDEEAVPLERHLAGCEDCRRAWNALIALREDLAAVPLVEPSPNLLAASRVRLDDALDAIPARTLGQRLAGDGFRWLSVLRGSPALATLLAGTGFLAGSTWVRYQVANAPRPPQSIVMEHSAQGSVASVSGIVQTPDTDVVQVNYNRLVPETVQGSLNDPSIRELLLLGTRLAANNDVHLSSVALLADECRHGRDCDGDDRAGEGSLRKTLLNSLRFDKSPAVRLKALAGLQPYVAEDEHVRDAVLKTVMHDASADVRGQAITLLSPVGADLTVREALRTVSTRDSSPAIRNASFQVLQNASDVQ